MARNAGIVVYPEDKMVPDVPENLIQEGVVGDRYVIDRATPVTLILYGNVSGVRTKKKDRYDLMKERISSFQKVIPWHRLQIQLHPDMKITITREGQQIVTVEEEIPAPIEYVDDANMTRRYGSCWSQELPAVKKVVTYEIKTEMGLRLAGINYKKSLQFNPRGS